MPFYIAGFVLGRVLAQQRGIVDGSSLNRVALVGGVAGPSPAGLIVTSVVANREAESIPPALVDVPDVRTLDVGDARQKLKDLGLGADELEILNTDPASTDKVFDQDPKPPSRVAPGSAVTLTVNKLGVSVPFVIGSTFEPDARLAIEHAKLRTARADERSTLDVGKVFQTDPARNSVVAEQSVVTVYVSTGLGGEISKRPSPSPR
jgi:beta-lactam-binding protein with PASTA domain